MVLVINQQTFDDAVKENISEFGMEIQEAINDAVKQFEAQGVDLSNIIKNNLLSPQVESTHDLKKALSVLREHTQQKIVISSSVLQEQLSVIKNECDKSIPHRVIAGKEGAYSILLQLITDKNGQEIAVVKNSLGALLSLMTKQPDLLEDTGIRTIIPLLGEEDDIEMQKLILKWIKECCIMHEMNRQKIFQAGILSHLKTSLESDDSSLIRDVLGVLRALVLDDDVRVEFGKAHDHARVIASDTLSSITGLLTKTETDEPLVGDLLSTISALLVRTEFCKIVEEAGGLEAIKHAMVVFQDQDKIMRQYFKVLKALAGNDEVKIRIIQNGLAPLLIASLDSNKNSNLTATVGLGCIAALTLRSTENSKAFFDSGAPEVIYDCMTIHPDDASVQKNASWAIRNMVSRSRYQSQKFLDVGVEMILQRNLKRFPNHEFDTKSALRDLGCDVNLKEEWTGSGGLLTTQSKKNVS
ncbi:hypothetical protein PPYR_01005 [Photinus pyralis]|uniref:Armadillo repeat-containing protein 6 homolog n=1 Tax=Photinus pyralis TaxID=7054 RepID=A0A1Y1LJK2_PHOPY|nr:armadillo repeat-containing protein 6 homolog [Photinus pyralis]XP_031333293.1 armadillo repeat-containing protein 6 homolog [Photinus pyralis]KAB0804035.1 hypothetical protein PPYR_01005 [Photinus pyralis]